MSPSKREREYARQRYVKWQQRQSARAQRRRRIRTRVLAAGAALAVVATLVGAFSLAGDNSRSSDNASSDSTVTATPTADADNPCPQPTSTPPASPAQFDTAPDPATAENKTWTATITTSCGPITVQLFGDKAPKAVASFRFLAEKNFFAGTPCHRLTTTGIFVLQCGDPTGTGTGGPGYTFGPVENAPADNAYPPGTLAMARQGGNGNSQGSQFFLVYKDSPIPADAAGGYTVFGTVTQGLEIVQQIADGGLASDGVAPARAISIEEVTVQ